MLLIVRGIWAGGFAGIFLIFNLLLAAVPLVAAFVLENWTRRSRHPAQWGLLALWLLFLPNAPYLVTDLIHLKERPPVPLWFDAALLFCIAATGLLLAYLSVAWVQRALELRFTKTMVYALLGASFLLCGFGIYLGRILRWHSWHVLTRPFELFRELSRVTSGSREGLMVTLVYGGSLAIGYFALRTLAPRLAESSVPTEAGGASNVASDA